MWLFNTNALICRVAGIAGAFISIKWNDSRELAVTVAAMLFDAGMRFTNQETENPIINPEAGGHIWFAPIWVIRIILLILVGMSHYHIICWITRTIKAHKNRFQQSIESIVDKHLVPQATPYRTTTLALVELVIRDSDRQSHGQTRLI